MSDPTDTGERQHNTPEDEANFVPAWLAVLVLVLLLAVMGIGGYLIRGLVAGDKRAADVADLQVERWSEAVREDPDNLVARVNLGYSYQRDGRYDKAIREYEWVLEKDPRNTAALYNLGMVYRQLDLSDKAEEVLWKALETTPDHALAARELGELYAEREEYHSLIRAVRPVVEAHPEIADLQYLMGVAYEKTDRLNWAKARYRLALKYSPDYTRARDALRAMGEVP